MTPEAEKELMALIARDIPPTAKYVSTVNVGILKILYSNLEGDLDAWAEKHYGKGKEAGK